MRLLGRVGAWIRQKTCLAPTRCPGRDLLGRRRARAVADGRRALLRDMFENAKEKLVGERHPFRITGQGVPAIEPELRVAELAA